MARKTLVTRFGHADEAERVVEKLRQDGFALAHIGGVVRAAGGRELAQGSRRKGSARERVTVGGVLGGLVGLFIGATALTIAGIAGAIVVLGSLIGALAGAALGAELGRRIDAFARVDVPREQAHRSPSRLGNKDAAIVRVTVNDEEEEARALEILRGEASLHKHSLLFRIPALSDEGRPSRPSLA